jgi:Holliday junction resolvase RusA-like endonuclease
MSDWEKKAYDITPVPAPRMTRSDKWKKRDCVMRYFAFRDAVKAAGITIGDGYRIFFFLPMPESWSKKKKEAMRGLPHRQKPDIDNLCKALFDSVFDDDCHIAAIQLYKHWDDTGRIIIHHRPT